VLSSIDVCQNDALVLCSDGLSGLVKAEEIRQVVDNYCDEVEACRRLIDMANERGGYDNITVIVARFIGESLPMASEEDLVQYKLFDDSEEETTKLQGLPVTLPAEKKNDLTASPSSTSKFLLLSIVFVALATAVVALRIALRTPPSAGVSVAQSAQESKRPEVPLPTQPTDTVPIAQPPLPTASPAPDNRPLATAVGEGKAIAKAAAEMLVQEIRKNRPLIKKPGGAAAKPENAQQSVPKADGPPGPKPSTFEENSSKAIGRNIQNPQPGPPAGKHPEGQQDINEAGKAQPSVAETVPEGGEKAISGIKVEVVTEPAGLSFSVDGEELLRKTPSEFQLTPGKHKIRFRFGPILIVKEVEVLLEGKNRFDFLIDSTAPTTTVPPHS
jgi:hypothetical protein